MAMTNKFAGRCVTCGTSVAAGTGVAAKGAGGWAVFCAAHAPATVTPVSKSPRISLDLVDGEVEISCQDLDQTQFAAYRRAIDGAKWDSAKRCNHTTVAKVVSILDRLRQLSVGMEVTHALAAAISAHAAANESLRNDADDRLRWFDEIASRRNLAMYPYQREGARWLSTRKGALLADDMGLGKSMQALASLPYGSVIVLCPKSVRGNWRAEVAKWRPDLKATVVDAFRWPGKSEVVIMNYEKLIDAKALELYAQMHAAPSEVAVVIDEMHYLKNYKAKRTLRARALIEMVHAKGGRAWGLTGTPLNNRPGELWSLLETLGIADEAFGSYRSFAELHGAQKDGYGTVWGDAMPEVGERLQRVMLRRLKKDVLTQLPEKIYVDNLVEIDLEATRALDEVVAILEERGISIDDFDGTMPSFYDMSRVRAQVAAGKIPALLSLVETAEEEEQELVVFSVHRAPIETLALRPHWGAIMGGGDYFINGKRVKDAQEVVDAFQNGRLRGVACTGAGSTGITLTRSNHLIQVDLAWTPGDNDQQTDRIHRIGQTRACQITSLVADHPLERRIADVLATKRRHIEQSVNAAVVAPDADLVTQAVVKDAMISAMAAQLANLTSDAVTARKVEKTDHTAQRQSESDFVESAKRDAKARRTAGRRKKVADIETPTEAPIARPAQSAAEIWAVSALCQLASNDPDGAQDKNDVGFMKSDVGIGHSLAANAGKGLTPSEWKLAIAICKKYHRQVGVCPE